MTSNRVVFDTNVFVNGLFSTSSKPARAIEQAISRDHLLATVETLKELVTKLLSPKFDRYVSRQQREDLIDRLEPLIEIVDVVQIIRACRDPKDDKFLEASVNGRADLLVTGDKDLLTLSPFMGVVIVTPDTYLAEQP